MQSMYDPVVFLVVWIDRSGIYILCTSIIILHAYSLYHHIVSVLVTLVYVHTYFTITILHYQIDPGLPNFFKFSKFLNMTWLINGDNVIVLITGDSMLT